MAGNYQELHRQQLRGHQRAAFTSRSRPSDHAMVLAELHASAVLLSESAGAYPTSRREEKRANGS